MNLTKFFKNVSSRKTYKRPIQVNIIILVMNFKRMKLQKVNLRETPKKIHDSCFREMGLPNFMLDVKFFTLQCLLMIFHCFLIKASRK